MFGFTKSLSEPVPKKQLSASSPTPPTFNNNVPADTNLAAYAESLNQPIGLTINMKHEFLRIEEEAEWEQQSFFGLNRRHNEAVVQTLVSDVCAGTTVASISVEDLLVVSVGTSSTQIFSSTGVVGAVYIGYSGLTQDPELIHELLAYISTHSNQYESYKAVVFTNAISYISNKHLLLNDTDAEHSAAIHCKLSQEAMISSVDSEMNLVDNEHEPSSEQRSQALIVEQLIRGVATTRVSLSQKLFILQSRAISKFKYGWLELKAQRLMQAYSENRDDQQPNDVAPSSSSKKNCEGIYVVDFGGGGPVLSYLGRNSSRLSVVTKDRIFRTLQDEFVAQMMQANTFLCSPFYIQLTEFLKRNIWTHVWAQTPLQLPGLGNSMSSAESDHRDRISSVEEIHIGNGSANAGNAGLIFEKETPSEIKCFIIQTGKARQQHFLGHTRQQVSTL
jgi:hypothetical protein